MLALFFRKKLPQFHSIEYLFDCVSKYYKIKFQKIYLPYHSGVFKRIFNIFFARSHRAQINHITGDVFYIALGLPKKSLVLTIHDIGSLLQTSNPIKKFIFKKIWFEIPLKRAKIITVISEFSKKELVENFPFVANKIVVIPNCVEESFVFKPKKQLNNPPLILAVGTKENKNLLRLFEAVKKLNVKLLIVGKLNERQKLILEKYQIDFENYFNIPKKQLVDLYHRSDLLYFASTYEGFGLPILEAQATGTPLITSDKLPMKDVAADGALFVDPYNVEEIKNAIVRLLEDESLRKALIEKGLKNVKNYKPQAIAKQYENVYAEILKNE